MQFPNSYPTGWWCNVVSSIRTINEIWSEQPFISSGKTIEIRYADLFKALLDQVIVVGRKYFEWFCMLRTGTPLRKPQMRFNLYTCMLNDIGDCCADFLVQFLRCINCETV